MPEVFDVNDSATQSVLVTRSIETALETGPYIGASIAPLVGTEDDRVKVGRVEVEAFGVAQVVARYAAPAIFVPAIKYEEEWIELVKLDEMWPIEEDEWFDLTSGNEYQKRRRGVDILARARILQLRSERKTEQMRWASFHDALTLTLSESGQTTAPTITVKYNQPSGNRPDLSNWRDRANSTPITDIRTAQRIPFNLISQHGLNIYMHGDTLEDLQFSKQVADLLKPNTSGDFFIPTLEQVEKLLIGGSVDARNETSGRVRVIETNAGYRAEGATGRGAADMTYFLPRDYVLITTTPIVEGEKIAEMLDGRVLTKDSPSAAEPTWKIGATTETFYSPNPPYTKYTRQVCKRVPRINVPEAFVYAYVGA